MKQIGILIETENNRIKQTNFGVMTLARKVGKTITALVAGPVDKEAVETLGRYGVDRIIEIFLPEEPAIQNNPVVRARALGKVIKEEKIGIILGLSSGPGKDLIPRLAALLDVPLVMDCVDLEFAPEKDQFMGITSQYSGKTLAKIQLTGERVIFGIRPNAIKPLACQTSPEVTRVDVPASEPEQFRILNSETRDQTQEQVSLTEADIIIAGGRGLKSKESFDLLFECAKRMGAAVGASRVAVDQDWIPYAHQVGQTGEKVSPSVYIACGISGSIQHFAGMKTAGMIIAVNLDENSAMVANSDYYVIGDLFEILPELARQL